nr:MAG TPA: Single-stranded DNA-binding protein/DNA complex, OB fold, beta-barrel, single-stranded [Caudoviricetes sp.]
MELLTPKPKQPTPEPYAAPLQEQSAQPAQGNSDDLPF